MSNGWPFNQIYHVIWRSKRVRALQSSDDKLLLFWYMTCDHQNALGFFRCPDHYPAADMKWDVNRVADSRANLDRASLIYYDEETEELYIDQWLRFATKPSPKVLGAYQRQVDSIESDYLRDQVVGPALVEAQDRWSGGVQRPARVEDKDPSSATITPQLQAALARQRGTG